MSIRRNVRSLALLVAALAAPTRASVIVVAAAGGGDFSTLPAALAAAGAGDILLVRAGDYFFDGPINTAGSLTLVADSTGEQPNLSLDITGLPGGATLIVRGFYVPNFGFGSAPLVFQDCAGAVLVEECGVDFDYSGGFPGLAGLPEVFVSNCAALSFVGCTLIGGRGGDQWLQGAAGSLPSQPGGAGAELINSHVAFHGCVLTGGVGGFGSFIHGANGGPGLSLTNSTALLAGSIAQGGKGGDGCASSQLSQWCAGGPGAWLDASSTLQSLEGSWIGGVAGQGSSGQFGLPGPPFVGPASQPVVFDGSARSLHVSSPVREQQTGTLSLDGVAGDVVFAFSSFDGGSLPLPGKKGWLALGAAIHGPFVLGTIVDPSGKLAVPFTAPDLVSPLFEGQTFLMQGVFVGTGGLTLGSVSSFTLVDAAF